MVGLWASVVPGLCAQAESRRPTLITSLKVDVQQEKIAVHIEADRMLSIQTMVLTNPDRIVMDAAGALFKVEKPEILINTSPVKSVRIGLFQAKPPVTRIVVETFTVPTFDFRTEHNSAFLDIALPAAPRAPAVTVEPVVPPNVTYDRGLLTIVANNSTLAEILNAVHSRTGGMTEFPAAAADERATVNLGPAPLASVLADLLLGSPFDYVIAGSGKDPSGIQIVLTEKSAYSPPQAPAEAPVPAQDVALASDPGEMPVLENGEVQQEGNTQFMVNQAMIGLPMVERVATPDNEERTPEADPQTVRIPAPRPSKENPRVPPPDKHP